MTEQEWLEGADPRRMLDFLRWQSRDRKARLFACACCRKVWPLFTDERCRQAVEVTERFIEGLADEQELLAAREAAREVFSSAVEINFTPFGAWRSDKALADAWIMLIAMNLAHDDAWYSTTALIESTNQTTTAGMDVEYPEACLLHDIFGNPFRPVTIDPAWLTSTVASLAQAIYDDRAFDRMPILADALEDAGCDNADLLNHCRQPGEHVRGCFVVDLLLGKQ